MPHRSFRLRLLVWNAVVVTATAAATIVVLRFGIQYALLREMDQLLLQDLNEVELSFVPRGLPDSPDLQEALEIKAEAHKLNGWYVRFLDHQGVEIWSTRQAPPKTPLLPDLANGEPISLGEYRVVQYQYQPQNKALGPITIRVGSRLTSIAADVRRVDQLAIVVAVLMLVAAPVFSYWLTGQVTQPLAELTKSAEQMRPERLADRLPIRQTGDELDQLSHTVNRLLDRIAAYLERKRDFLANAAHELRTPLAAIRSSVEVALAGQRNPEEYRELLDDLIQECASLETLVNQLLLLAEAEGEERLGADDIVNWDEIAQKSVDMFEPVAEAQGIKLVANLTPRTRVIGNPHHLRRVLNNLIDNAIKYTPTGGTIRIELTQHPESERTTLVVEDTGRGIKSEDVPRVFERFFRSDKAHQRDSGTRGTGLGLSICQAIVAAHQGSISLESEPGRGTKVTVTLPLKRD